jgi:NAD(P)-dependent dehydrogenase (short-subunit alcohol dehydrogenase family)
MKRDPNIQWKRVEASSLDLKGKRAAIVGGTGGLGRAIARLLASRGASVIVVGQTFRDADVPGIEFRRADMGLLREAKRVAQELPAESLDLVILTTGIFAAPKRQETAEGLERDMAVSYLNRLVIVREIAPRLRKDARVFVMGYPGAGNEGKLGDLNSEKSYDAWAAHLNTVVGNEILVLDSARRYPNVRFFGLNPGLIKTAIRNNYLGEGSLKSRVAETLIGLFTPSPDQYAQTIAPLLFAPELDQYNGTLFDNKGFAIEPTPKLRDRAHADAFTAESEALVARVL